MVEQAKRMVTELMNSKDMPGRGGGGGFGQYDGAMPESVSIHHLFHLLYVCAVCLWYMLYMSMMAIVRYQYLGRL